MAKVGRKKKYGTAKALREAVDAYFASISYEVPAVISTPTGEVDADGLIVYKCKLLTEHFDGTGKPKTVVKYLVEPSVEGICLYLGICRDTWAEYGRTAGLGDVVENARLRIKAHLMNELGTRNSVQGIIFNLKANYGMTDRVEITHRGGSVEEYLAGLKGEQEL